MASTIEARQHTETFSYLPQLSRQDIERQIRYILANGWIPGIEYTDKPDPADSFWQFWELPLFEARAPEDVLSALDACSAAHPDAFIRITGYDNVRQGQVLAFVAERPR